MFKQTAIGLTCLLLAGCASLISSRLAPSDWPRLDVQVHRVAALEVIKRCSKYLTPSGRLMGLGLVGGCAEINFSKGRCDIWVPHDVDNAVLEHEMEHCAGKDHPGDETLRLAWANFKAGR